MRTIIILGAMLMGFSVFAQTKINGVGVAFDVNGSATMSSLGIDNLLKESAFGNYQDENSLWTSRILTSYTMTLSNPNRDHFAWEIDLLQGQDFYYASNYEYRQSNDTNYNSSSSLDINGSVLGLRTMFKLRTPSDKRFFYHFGLGLEGLYSYNLKTSGYNSESIWHYPTDYYQNEYNSIDAEAVDNITSLNLIQQVGVAFRIGKTEASFPLNRTYIEADFQIMNNFTNINKELSTYRGYGGSFSLIYEFR